MLPIRDYATELVRLHETIGDGSVKEFITRTIQECPNHPKGKVTLYTVKDFDMDDEMLLSVLEKILRGFNGKRIKYINLVINLSRALTHYRNKNGLMMNKMKAERDFMVYIKSTWFLLLLRSYKPLTVHTLDELYNELVTGLIANGDL